ncbi:MAG TPA: fibronectin type III domain-containing protein [Rhodopila sp.]|jgi:hypothetical protein|nr:fibronectin type III domain-containing protein [Rhodopila sp.]
MPVYRPTPRAANLPKATMHALSATAPAAAATPQIANTPEAATLAQGPGLDLTVTWAAPSADLTHGAATGFNLQYSLSGQNAWTLVPNVGSPYVLSGLAAATSFDVQVQSTNAAGTSPWSATSTLATAGAAPNVPATVSLTQGSGTSLTVIWTTPATDSTHSAATGFNLRYSPSGANNWTVVSGVSSPYTLSGLAAGAAIDVAIESVNAAGTSAWSATSTLTTATSAVYAPNAPTIAGVAPPPDGTTSKLTVTWSAPAADSTHGAATGYNLRYSPSGANSWTTVSNVTSPYTITNLAGATAIDVQVQGTNAATSLGAWAATTTGTSWGATVAPGGWTAAASQVHATGVAPNGGVQMTAVAAPTAVSGAAFGWTTGATTPPTSGLIAATADGQANGWGQYFNAPATAGTYYLWMLAQGAGGATIGALVTSAITVS